MRRDATRRPRICGDRNRFSAEAETQGGLAGGDQATPALRAAATSIGSFEAAAPKVHVKCQLAIKCYSCLLQLYWLMFNDLMNPEIGSEV